MKNKYYDASNTDGRNKLESKHMINFLKYPFFIVHHNVVRPLEVDNWFKIFFEWHLWKNDRQILNE